MVKVLIANRGEIACRIIKSCKKLGLDTVAVYSTADELALHVEMADEAYEIGAPPVSESYLNIPAVMDAAKKSGAQYVHPGYGLLSENAEFAAILQKNGIGWVGPSSDSMRAMADKEKARAIANSANVPIIKGSDRFIPDENTDFNEIIEKIGFPVVVKATAGGGGIGMRICDKLESFAKIANSVSAMAARSFGDPTIFIERYVERARHVEVQIFGLGDGHALTLLDRDCSVQRRFQKVIEEAPAPALSETVREKMRQAACSLAAAQSYRGAGTVEFIVDTETEEFFFLEMNTRLQVEHPVTEMITGLDIVALQLQLELGLELDIVSQASLNLDGHAIECRIYAENPWKKFMPAPGDITGFQMPPESNNVRIDTGVREGSQITPYYDPLIAKVICHGANRSEAIECLSDTLAEIKIEGIVTNIDFLREMIRFPKFISEALHTKLIDEFFAKKYQ